MKEDGTMTKILKLIAVTTGVFVIIQMSFFYLTGAYMETMTTMWFTYILGESGAMGVIKVVKTIMSNYRLKQMEVEDEKNKLAAMAEKEAGK